MPEIDVMPKEEDEEQFADVLFLLVAVQRLVALKLGSNIGQLLINPFYFGFFTFT